MGRSERSSKWQEQNDELRSRLSCTSAQVSCSWNLHIQVGLLVDLCNCLLGFVCFFFFDYCLLSMSHPILSSVHPFEISSAYNISCRPREWVVTSEIWQRSQLLLKPLVALWHLQEWLTYNFSLQCYPWTTHYSYENKGNDQRSTWLSNKFFLVKDIFRLVMGIGQRKNSKSPSFFFYYFSSFVF